MCPASRGCRRHEATTVTPATCPGGRRPHPPRSSRMLPTERNTHIEFQNNPKRQARRTYAEEYARSDATLPDAAICTQTWESPP